MISIELWRARIGLYNCKRFSSILSSSSRCNHVYCEHRKRGNTLQEEKLEEKLTNTSSAPLFLWSLSLRRSLFRDVLVILVIAVVSQQLVISGDVEINPGPRASDRPTMSQLIHLDGTDVRVIKSITSLEMHKCVDFAYVLLGDDQCVKKHQSNCNGNKEDFVRGVLSDWLSRDDGNKSDAAVPRTWEALAECVTKADLDGTLTKSIRDSFSSGEDDNGIPSAKRQKVSHSSEDLSTHQSASEQRVQQLQEKLEAANKMCQEKDQKIVQLETKLQSQDAEIATLRSNLIAREKLLNDTLDDVVQHTQKLKEKALLNVGRNPDTGLSTSPSPLDNFTAYLKDVYLNTKLRHVFLEPNNKQFSPPFKFSAHECCMFGMTWTIGKLSTIDIGNPSYRQYNLSDGHGGSQPKLMFSPEPAKNILVVHPPGVGASLLCHEWAKGELLQRWSVVIRVQLHEKVIREDKDVLNLVYHPEHTVREAVFQKLVESKGRKVLFILDGYDQLSGKQKQACFVFHELILSKHFPQATLMVLMSQHSQHPQHDQEVVKALLEKFHQKIDQYIKILKFSDDDVHQYTTAICNDDPDLKSALNSFLYSRSFSYFQLYTPLQCTILTDLYCFHWKNGDKGFAPRTRTELYTDLVRTLLVQYLSSHSEYSKREWHIVEFTDLPGEVYEQFKALAQLAARGIQEREYVFDSGVPEDTLGLMYQVEERYPGRGRSVSYSFLHLTLQEYLAAYYCSLENPEDQLKQVIGLHNPPLRDFLSLHGKPSLQYHWQVLLFTVGITKLSWNADDLQLILRTCDRSRQAQFITGSMCLLYETQSPELIESALSFQQSTTEDKYLELEWVAKTPHELFIAGYCIPHSNRLWEYAHIATQFKDLFKGLSMSSSNNGGRIANLQVTTQQLIMLLSLMPSTSATQKIAKVTICGSNISECFDTCSKLSLCFPHLEELEVSADFSDYLLQLFIVLPEMKSLQKLCITFGNNWQTENMCAICERLQACQVKHLVINHACHAHGYYTYFSSNFMISCKLESLLLSHVTLGPELARCVGMESTALHKLTLHNCDIPNNACSALVDSIKSPHCVLETIALSPVISHDLLKALGSSSSSLKRCILSLDYTLELPHLNSGLKGNKTLEELTVLHVHRNTGMLFVSEIGMLNEAAVKPFMELIRMVDEHTSIRLLTVSSTKYNLQGFSSARNLTKNCRKTLEVQFVD